VGIQPPQHAQGRIAVTIQWFLYLQVLDFLTTMLGFKLGAVEASPFIRLLMHAGPMMGVLLSKLLALTLAASCLYFGKRHLVTWVTYWYAALVLWNLLIILAALGGRQAC
jgi:hypothetical protein